MANYTHTEYSHLLAQKCWQLLQGAEKIIIILQAARNQIICTHKRFSFWSLLCLACLGGGEKETYCLLKSKTVGLVLFLQEWRGLCAITARHPLCRSRSPLHWVCNWFAKSPQGKRPCTPAAGEGISPPSSA